ncbi:hypothetical protein ACFQ9V_07495 [Leifsonia sp. NPDC056665]|uniref:hypothetical protein n=1 Tax=Leifsonia sp. NPDC056665 TaxID=3345901 RepID=UPI0036B48477
MSFQPQPVYGPPGYYAAPPAPLRPRTLGAVSMGLALGVFVLSLVASVYIGMTAGPLMHGTAGTAYTVDSTNLSQAQLAAFAPIGVLMGAQMLFGTVLGILALVLGIIAVATKRGRAFGVVGIAVAAAAPVLSFIVYTVTIAATAPHA